jgi:uncharacterized protein YegP (UPF0339 family)
MAGKFEIFKDKAKQYRFHLKAANGEIIASSEAYPDKRSALKGIASIQKNAVTAKIVDETGEAEPVKKPAAKARATAPAKTGAVPKAAAKPRGRKPKTV